MLSLVSLAIVSLLFLCVISCHLQIVRFLLLPFQSIFLYFFFFSVCHGWTSKTVLNSSSQSGHPCLPPDLGGNAFCFSPMRTMFPVRLWLFYIQIDSFYANFPESFYHKWVLNFVESFIEVMEIVI